MSLNTKFEPQWFNVNYKPLPLLCAGGRIGTRFLRPGGTGPPKGTSLVVGDV